MSTQLNIQDLKPLNSVQYDKCKQTALARVKKRIGDKPSRDTFKREYAQLWNVLDIALIVVFIGALLISFQHIFDYVSSVAGAHYLTMPFTTGLRLPHYVAVAAQQIGALLMAEAAMIAFFSYWRLDTHNSPTRRKYSHLLLWLALASAAYVLYVNTLGVGLWFDPTSWLAPFVTIGIGVRIEQILSEYFIRQREIDSKYTTALSQWERSTEDPTQHPDYLPILYTELWEYLSTKLTSNSHFADAPGWFKLQAVEREMSRENWTQDVTHTGHVVNPTQALLPAVEMSANGNGASH